MSDPYQPDYLEIAETAGRFLDTIQNVREIAVDTEGASFHRFIDRIYLLQLSTRRESAIIDPLQTGGLPQLGALLQNPQVEVVFHDADYDVRLLRQDYGWKVNNIFDTRIAAQLLGIKAFGLAALLDQFFGVKLDKAHQRADWSLRPLTPGMLDYAAQDTRYLLELRDKLFASLDQLGRLGWAREEFVRLETIQFSSEESSSAYLRVKGARDLERRELAILRELVPWRDSVAKSLDRATFRVVGNDALLEISRIRPTTATELSKIRGISRSILDRHGREITDAVERGLAVPDADLPRFPRAPRWNRDPDFDENVAKLKAVRESLAQKLNLDPGVLCARDRLEAVARKKPQSVAELAEIPELRRWQIEVLGEGLVKALR